MKIKTSKTHRANKSIHYDEVGEVSFNAEGVADVTEEHAALIMAEDDSVTEVGKEKEKSKSSTGNKSDITVTDMDKNRGVDGKGGNESNAGHEGTSGSAGVDSKDESRKQLEQMSLTDLQDLLKAGKIPNKEWKDLNEKDCVDLIIKKDLF